MHLKKSGGYWFYYLRFSSTYLLLFFGKIRVQHDISWGNLKLTYKTVILRGEMSGARLAILSFNMSIATSTEKGPYAKWVEKAYRKNGNHKNEVQKRILPGVSRTPDLKITMQLQSRALASLATERNLYEEQTLT